MDGFAGGDIATKWDLPSQSIVTANTAPRTAGNYYGDGNTNGRLYKSITASTKVIVGSGLYINGGQYIQFFGDSGATAHISVVHNTTTRLMEIRRGASNGTLLATGTQQVFDATWNYFEVSCTISDTVGEVHVRLNGSTTDEVSYTGDTKNGGTATTIDTVRWEIGSASRIADVYILNDTGAAPNNNFLGDVVVRTLSPSGNGTYSQLVGSDSDSINNYLLVDEHPFSSTDYVGSPTTGQKDSYAISDLPAGVTTVYGVQVSGQMFKSDATVAQSRLFIRSGGTDYGGSTRTLITSPVNYYEYYSTNPATGLAWTPSDVNNLESGMEVM
jgi:hypothetical protein